MEDKQLQHFKRKLDKALQELHAYKSVLLDADESKNSLVVNNPAESTTNLTLSTTDLALDEFKNEEQ